MICFESVIFLNTKKNLKTKKYFFLGLGLGLIQNASFVSINSYFKVRKSLAVGLAMAGTGVGQTLMPHVVRYLLEHYGFKGACLLLASLSLHGVNIYSYFCTD